MDQVVKIIGIVFVAMAVLYLLKPDIIKWLMEFFKKGRRIYFAAVIRLALAVVFLLAARGCKNFWVIFVFGLVFLISGLLIFLLGSRRVGSIIEWWQRQSDLLFRILSLVVLAVGAIIIIYA